MNNETTCPVCGSERLKTTVSISTRYGGNSQKDSILFCKSCSHRFLPSNPAKQSLIEESYDGDYVGFRMDEFFLKKIEREIKNNFISRIPPPAKILDVGCGNGMFMSKAKESGYQVEGIDISEAAIKHCRKKGLNTHQGDFLTKDFAHAPYDFITMWDVVEHLREPRKFIKKTRSILHENGILVLKIPGFNTLSFKILSLYGNGAGALLGAPNHIQYFNEKSLRTLLNECGFKENHFVEVGDFRKKPETNSLVRKFKRLSLKSLHRLSGDKNLYVYAK